MKRILMIAAVLGLSVLSAYAQENNAPPPSDAPSVDMVQLCASRQGQTRFYPPRALQRGIGGRVELDCAYGADDTRQSCQVVHEEPQGFDFGTAALRLTCRSHQSPANPGEAIVYTPEGGTQRHMRHIVNFNLSNGPPPPH